MDTESRRSVPATDNLLLGSSPYHWLRIGTAPSDTGDMKEGQRHETEWEGLRLVVDECQDHFQAFVYDPAQCEVVYTAARVSLATAKVAAVEFAAISQFGSRHDLRPEVIALMLVWERIPKD